VGRTRPGGTPLVFDEDGAAQGSCQNGRLDGLHLKHEREHHRDPPPPARWRVGCIFVDKGHLGQGIARGELQGALAQIEEEAGGLVEAISETTTGRGAQGRFLSSGTWFGCPAPVVISSRRLPPM
jgi:GNAT superfamily N-acetyltransferase